MGFRFQHKVRLSDGPVGESSSIAKLTHFFGLAALGFLILGALLIVMTTVVWPAENSRRQMFPVALLPDGCLLVEYPVMLDAESVQEPLRIFVSATNPTTVTLAVPFVIGVEQITPFEKVTRQQIYRDVMAVDLQFGVSESITLPQSGHIISALNPISIGIPMGCSTWQISATSPLAVKQVETSTLALLNRHSEQMAGWPIPTMTMVQSAAISVSVDSLTVHPLPIALETTFRKQIAKFVAATGENSILLALAAMTASFGGWLFSRWQTNLHQKEVDRAVNKLNAEKLLNQFINQVALCNHNEALDTANTIRQGYKDFMSEVDLERIEHLTRTMGGVPPDDLPVEEFAIWPDAWAGAFILACKDSRIKESPALRRYIRMFPRERLRSDTAHRFELTFDAFQLQPSQARIWPIRPSDPGQDDLHLSKKLLQAFSGVDLFPNDRADVPFEQQLLFSTLPGFYWRFHPVALRVEQSPLPVFVTGRNGCGKTALGLAYGRYLHPNDTFATYVAGHIDMSTIQRSLASTLLFFVRQHPTWLVHFDNSTRNLCASVLTSVLDRQYLLASLGATSLKGFNRRVGANADNADEPIVSAWKAHAATELRLLYDAVESAKSAYPDDFSQWLGSFTYCTNTLQFHERRIAVDLHEACTSSEFELIARIMETSGLGDDQQYKILVLASDPTAEKRFVNTSGFLPLDMSWKIHDGRDPLYEMLKFRCVQAGANVEAIDTVFDDLERLFEICSRNPGRVAQLWNCALEQYGDTTDTIGQTELDNLSKQLDFA